MVNAYGEHCQFLKHVFDNYCKQLYQQLSKLTNNLHELAYIFMFLYPSYINKLYKEIQVKNLSPEDAINNNSLLVSLFDRSFKETINQVCSNLYMHMSSLNELQKEVKEKKDDDLVKNAQNNQPKLGHEDGKKDDQTFGFKSINYV